MQCEMCGKSIESYFRVKVEGTILNLCDRCMKFGELIEAVKPQPDIKTENILKRDKPSEPEIIEELITYNQAQALKNEKEASVL